MRTIRGLSLLLVLVLVLVLGCGGPQSMTPRAEDMRSLTENRALALIADALSEAGLERGARFDVDIAAESPLEVDVRLAASRYGIEWVSAQDRADYGEAIPTPTRGGELQILPGNGEDEQVEILILDANDYRYDPDQDRVYHGSTSNAEVEARLSRDVSDYLEYCRGQM